LHLVLRVLGRRCHGAACAIHRAGRRVLICVRAGTGRLAGVPRRRPGTCVLVCSPAGAVAGARLGGACTQDHNGAARENEAFDVHMLLPGYRLGTYLACQHGGETDPCAAGSEWKCKSRNSSITRGPLSSSHPSSRLEGPHGENRSSHYSLFVLRQPAPNRPQREAPTTEAAPPTERNGSAKSGWIRSKLTMQCSDRQAAF
jgi:hypothetical protein